MDDFDITIINAYLNLVKGDVISPLKDMGYTKQFIEEQVRSSSGRAFPADLILFSKRYNHACIIEIKNTTTTEMNTNQAHGYRDLNHESLRETLPAHRELPRITIDIAYHGHASNEQHLARGLTACGVSFPLLILDSDRFTIKKSALSGDFNYSRIKNIFHTEIALNIDDLDKIVPYIKYGIETDNYKLAKIITPELIARIMPITAGDEEATVLIEDIAKSTYSMLGPSFWNELNPEHKRKLTLKVRDTFMQMRDNGLHYIKIRDGRFVGLAIYDDKGEINQATLIALKQRIERAGPSLLTTQTTIV